MVNLRTRLSHLPVIVKILVGVAVIALIWIGVNHLVASKNSAPQYQTATVSKGTLIVSTTGSGTVSSTNNSPVNTSATGVVSQVFVKDGDLVTAGDPLARITLDQTGQQNSSSAFAAYQGAKNNLDSAQANIYSLQSKLFAANQKFMNDAAARDLAIDDPTYIQQNADWLAAESNYKSQQQVIAQAQSSLTSAWLSYQKSSPVVSAPISGRVSGFSLQPGSVITSSSSSSSNSSSSTKIASIITDAAPVVVVNLTEIDVSNIRTGNKATVLLDAFPDKTFAGTVVSLDTSGVVSSGVTSYPAAIKLTTDSRNLLPNMSASATIITATKDDVLIVPSAAVVVQNGSSYVRILKNKVMTSVPVETGLSSDTEIEIVSGANEGDVVVTSVITPASVGTSRPGQSASPFGAFGAGTRVGGGGGGGAVFRVR